MASKIMCMWLSQPFQFQREEFISLNFSLFTPPHLHNPILHSLHHHRVFSFATKTQPSHPFHSTHRIHIHSLRHFFSLSVSLSLPLLLPSLTSNFGFWNVSYTLSLLNTFGGRGYSSTKNSHGLSGTHRTSYTTQIHQTASSCVSVYSTFLASHSLSTLVSLHQGTVHTRPVSQP